MYLIGQSSTMSIANWRVMFLVCGAGTILSGIAFIFLMPKDTTTAWFLNEAERKVATERLAMDRSTRDHTYFNKDQVKEGLFDLQVWLLFGLALFICIPSPILKVSNTQSGVGLGSNIPTSFHLLLSMALASAISKPCLWDYLVVRFKSSQSG